MQTIFAATSSTVHFFDGKKIAAEPWANGIGMTRTIARGSNGDWRVSIADLNGAAEFSQFAGFDRTFTVIDDATVDLHSQDGTLSAYAGQPLHFSGDLQVWIDQPAAPIHVLNVMTRRGSYRSNVSAIRNASRIASTGLHIVVCLSASWQLKSRTLRERTLQPLQGICFDGIQDDLDIRPLSPNAQLLSIDIRPHLAR